MGAVKNSASKEGNNNFKMNAAKTSPSKEKVKNNISKENVKNSPSNVSVKNSSSKENMKNSPSKGSVKDSLSKGNAKISPSKENTKNNPSKANVKNSSEKENMKNSPPKGSVKDNVSKTNAKNNSSKEKLKNDPSKTNAKNNPSKEKLKNDPSKTNAKNNPSKEKLKNDPSKTNAKNNPSKEKLKNDLSKTNAKNNPSKEKLKNDLSKTNAKNSPSKEKIKDNTPKKNAQKKKSQSGGTNKTVWIMFGSLLLDLLAFTMILPLLPSLLEHYRLNDSPSGCYKWFETSIKYFQEFLGAPQRFNSVLFGGALGSMFSFLQFLASPLIGGLSDVYGRKPVMLICLGGICFSYILWALSKSFAIFILARIVGGISKGNVSLSMAVISDVSSISLRGKAMALVGIAFSMGFIVGPVIGAAFAKWSQSQHGDWFVVPAVFALLLSVADLLFVAFYFKESLPKHKRAKSVAESLSQATAYINFSDIFRFKAVRNIKNSDLSNLQTLGMIYFTYLLIYSGLEFTLTFLTHHTFQYTSMEQGWMFFGIGLIMAILQSSWVRKLPQEKIKPVATLGLLIIIPSFVLIGLATSSMILFVGLLLFAVSTAMVVSCMTTLASKFGPDDQKGTILGIFRSLGALARAIGPIIASTAFWSVGHRMTYLAGAFGLIWPWYTLRKSQIS